MYQEDYFNPASPNDYNDDEFGQTYDVMKNLLRQDKGLNTLTRKVQMENGKIKNKRIKVFTSGIVGARIRDAETGEYYPNKVGSRDEDLFFKVIVSTGECSSANGSNKLFYISPQHYENHLYTDVDPKRVAEWETKRNARLKELKKTIQPKFNAIIVK
jgi:hypothetical protein